MGIKNILEKMLERSDECSEVKNISFECNVELILDAKTHFFVLRLLDMFLCFFTTSQTDYLNESRAIFK